MKTLLQAAANGPLPDWERVQSAIQLRSFGIGSTVFAQDVAHPYVYAVRSGLLKLCYLSEDGKEWIKSFVQEGQFFASTSALALGGRTSFLAAALEPTSVEQLDYRLLAELAAAQLPWSTALHALTLVHAARKEQRERELLTLGPEERYMAFRQSHPQLEKRIPQKDLARHLGLSAVGLNRIVVRVRRRAGT